METIQMSTSEIPAIEKWLKSSDEFKKGLNDIVELSMKNPERAVMLIRETKKFILETPDQPAKQIDQYLNYIASAEQKIGRFDEAVETIRQMSQDIFLKIYELLQLADYYIEKQNFDKAKQILAETQNILPAEFDYNAVDLGFMEEIDLTRSKIEIEKRVKGLSEKNELPK